MMEDFDNIFIILLTLLFMGIETLFYWAIFLFFLWLWARSYEKENRYERQLDTGVYERHLDERGYERDERGRLIHRRIAYRHLYIDGFRRGKYKKRFKY